jgi:photosystem II stability/assembly factor-like uncharacterized protein
MNPISRARAALAPAALAFLAACAGSPAPTQPPAEVVIAPPPMPTIAEPTPAPEATQVASAAVLAPPPEAPAPGLDVTITPGLAGAFGGAAGNVPHGISSIWGAGNRVFAVGSGMILRSEDRGLHFHVFPGPEGAPVVWGASADEVYVAGDKVVRSTDGGATWSPAGALPGGAYGIWGSGPGDVYAVGGGSKPFIARSIDHGATWTELAAPVTKGWFYSVSGTGPREILVVGTAPSGAPATTPGLPPKSAVFLRSTDSGRHWTQLPTFPSTTTEFEESRGACFTSKGLFAASSYALHFTSNLGRTWKLVKAVNAEVLALGCRGDDILVGGRNRKLFASRDGGATWVEDPIGPLFAAPSFSSVQAAFVGEGGEAYVGLEGLYVGARRGSLFRRSP